MSVSVRSAECGSAEILVGDDCRRSGRRRRASSPSAPVRDAHQLAEVVRRPLHHLAVHPRADGYDRRAVRSVIASRIPGTARIGPIEITGFEGPITISVRLLDRREHLGRGPARSTPSSSTPSGFSPRCRIMNSWNGSQRPPAFTARAHGLVAHRQHRRVRGRARVHHRGVRVGEAGARREQLGAHPAQRQVAVAQPEPRRPPRRASMTSQVSPAMPQPRSSMTPASQYAIRSGSGETCTPWISTSSPVLAITRSSSGHRRACRAASLAPPVPPARSGYHSSSGRPVSLMPAWVL